MRIALATDWFPPRRGGIETQLSELAERLVARGHQVDVLTTTPGARDIGGVRVHALRSMRLPLAGIAISPTLPLAVRTRLSTGYDVVHAHVSVVSPLAYTAAIVARTIGLPTVLSFHSVLHLKRHLLAIVDSVSGMSDGPAIWSGVSELVTSQLRSALPRADVVTLSNACDLAFWRAAPRAHGSATSVTLVSASRLHRKKRPLALVHAFANARRSFISPTQLVLVGDGPEMSSVRRAIVKRGLSSGMHRVETPGWITRDELRSLYGRARGFVLASRNESFGIAALEARVAGLPVIAMRQSGSSEFLHDDVNALLCDDDADLTRAIGRLVTNDALRAKLASGAVPLDRYDWPFVVEQAESVYRRASARAGNALQSASASA